MSIGLQYQSSFYKPKTYKDMEEKTLFKLARAITDTGTDTVPSEGGTVTYRITSLKRKLVNGKVVSTSTPSCTLGSASVSWATWGGVTVGDGYLDVKINYSENTGSSRSTTLTFTQNGSNNKINLTVTQGSGVTYTGYIKMVSTSLPLGGSKGNTAQIIVTAYLKGSDGSKKSETPHVGSAPDWCSASVASGVTLDNYHISLTALSDNNTGANRSGHIFLTCGDANLSIPVTQGSGVTYTGYIKMVSNSLPLGGSKGNTAQIIVTAYLKGSDGSKKSETPHVGSAPDWCSASVASGVTLDNYHISLTALSDNNTGANRSGHIFLTCGDANLSIPVTQITAKKITDNITISVFKSPNSTTQANCDIRSDQLVASNITFRLQIQYGVSSGDIREYIYTLVKGSAISRNTFAIQNEANPRVVEYGYSPQEDSKYIYDVTVI